MTEKGHAKNASAVPPIAEHIAIINHLSNKPVVMLYDKKVLCFHELNEAV